MSDRDDQFCPWCPREGGQCGVCQYDTTVEAGRERRRRYAVGVLLACFTGMAVVFALVLIASAMKWVN